MSNRQHRPRRHLDRQSTDNALSAADGRVVRMVIDSMIPGATQAWRPRRRVVEHGDERLLHVVVRPKVEMVPPADDTVRAFEQVKRACANIARPHLLADPTTRFSDLGADHYTRHIDTARRTRHLVHQLQPLGHQVSITPAA